jgi:diguanylate cyclase (GGDEF)-like protein
VPDQPHARKVLLIEDNAGDARLLREMVNEEHESSTDVTHVECLREAEDFLSNTEVDIVLLDLGLPDAEGLTALRRTQTAAPRVPLVVLTGTDDEVLAAQAMRAGAQDYLIKGRIESRGLLRALRYAIERKLLEEDLFLAKERAQVTLGCIGDAVICTDNAGNITFLNPVAEKMTGWSSAEAIGRPMFEIFRTKRASPGVASETTEELAILQIRAMHLPSSCILIRRDGNDIAIENSIAPIHDRSGKAMGAVIVCRDVTESQAMARQIAVSRHGGDEFIVLLSDVHQPEATSVMASKLLAAVAAPLRIEQHDLHITTSIGVSVFPDDGSDAETLIKNADTAMYQAKENGRRSFQFFKPAMNARAVERQFIEEHLRRALVRQEFILYYQPKVDLRTGMITGAEALVRWNHPERGPLAPAHFIPIAEDCGLIVPIGKWVVPEACRQARAWVEAGLPKLTIAVNISAIEFRDGGFLDSLFATLEATGLDPSTLELELTESVFTKNAESTAAILQSLRQRGVRVAIDDFGTGYSSFSYLRKFPIDTLKIDQSFVRQIIAGSDDAAIVTAVISMARSLRMRVVAEGVERQEELDFLRTQHCDDAQGYLFSKPVPGPVFVNLLKNSMPGEDGRWIVGGAAPMAPTD